MAYVEQWRRDKKAEAEALATKKASAMEVLMTQPVSALQLAHIVGISKPTAYKYILNLHIETGYRVHSKSARTSLRGPISTVYWVEVRS